MSYCSFYRYYRSLKGQIKETLEASIDDETEYIGLDHNILDI